MSPNNSPESDDAPPTPAPGAGRPSADAAAAIDPRLLDLLVCPLTKTPLRYDRARQALVSDKAGLAYPIRDGIPIMLVDEAKPLDDAGT
jgi:uncharacterized protein YbaR (Trm112 family)